MDELQLRSVFHGYLTGSQETAVNLLDDFLINDIEIFILSGYAGTGKTFLIKGLAEYFDKFNIDFFLMAPTGRSARILSEITEMRSSTVHSAIYQPDTPDDEEIDKNKNENIDKIIYKIRENTSYSAFYIIDESSMISNEFSGNENLQFGSGYLLNDLIEYINPEFNKIIFVGDPAQLPPVGSEISPALNENYLKNRYRLSVQGAILTDIVRQKNESGILNLSMIIRNSIREERFSAINLNDNYADLNFIGQNEVVNEFIKSSEVGNLSKSIIVAYTNKSVKQYNQFIREKLYPGEKSILSDESIILVQNSYAYEIDLYNGDFGKVIDVDPEKEIKQITVSYKGETELIELVFRDITIEFKDLDGLSHEIDCKIIDPLLESENRDISKKEQLALYVDFRIRYPEIKPGSKEEKILLRKDEYFNCLRVKYGYAVTCHKAQGGEWDNVICDIKYSFGRIDQNYLRWLYTAVTRAKNRLTLVNYGNIINHNLPAEPEIILKPSDKIKNNLSENELLTLISSRCFKNKCNLRKNKTKKFVFCLIINVYYQDKKAGELTVWLDKNNYITHIDSAVKTIDVNLPDREWLSRFAGKKLIREN